MKHLFFVLIAALLAAAVSGCTNTVIIYDYSTRSPKTPPDTVYVEKPHQWVPPGPTEPAPPPDITEPTPQIPGRWSSIQPLTPGTARIETILSPIDSLVIYRVHGNVVEPAASAIPEAGSEQFDLDPEVWRNTRTDVRIPFLSVVFTSRNSWTDVDGSPEVLILSDDGASFARFTLGRAEEVVPIQLASGGYSISMRFRTTAGTLETLARTDGVTVTLIDGERRTVARCSDANTLNFHTFYDVYFLGDGTKASAREGE